MLSKLDRATGWNLVELKDGVWTSRAQTELVAVTYMQLNLER